jgi:pyrroloquinoline quinone biosynthesis protein E
VYCSNPVDFHATKDALDGDAWCGVLREAAALGVVHVGLTGGEPTLHPDLASIVAGAADAKLYPHLVTAGTTRATERLDALVDAGLRSVQLSIQDADAEASDAIAGVAAFEAKLAFAEAAKRHALPMTLNVVLHRHNLHRVAELVARASRLGAERLELANAQYHGWALRNRDALMPSREQLQAAGAEVARLRPHHPDLEILFVLPDHFRGRPKPCMGGWGRKSLVVTPDGDVLPCHSAAQLPGLEFWRVPERSLVDCWSDAPGMNAYRGDAWMPEPCRSCDERERDFGGCRCQAFALLGDPAATDPACTLAPGHDVVVSARNAAERDAPDWIYRG